jgi:tetratricopeptide (TPR) repeat protein
MDRPTGRGRSEREALLKKAPLILFLIPASLFADQVFLKDAGSITGKIVEQTATVVRVDVGGGIIGVPADRVLRIEKGRCALDDYNDQAGKLAPDDLEGWKKLGRSANKQGLGTQARDAYKKALTIAPNDAEANTALGFVQLGGKWVTQEESYRARGYVQYEGEWMTSAEAQLAETRYANDKARRDAEQRARDAEAATREAESRAKEAEERAKEAERYAQPVYWGGWGYGVTAWPAGTPAPDPVFTPASQLKRNAP